jgi:hypothetical protein
MGIRPQRCLDKIQYVKQVNKPKPKWWNIVVGCLVLFPALKFPIDVQALTTSWAVFIYIGRVLVIALAARLIWSGLQHQKAQIR